MIFSGNPKSIQLESGDENLSVRELWSRWVDWHLTDDNSKYGIWMFNVGGDDIDVAEGTKIPIYLFLEEANLIHPKEANYTQTVSDGVLLVAGGGDPFDSTHGAFTVRVRYSQPVQAISFVAGESTGLTTGTIADAVREEMDSQSKKLRSILNNVQ